MDEHECSICREIQIQASCLSKTSASLHHLFVITFLSLLELCLLFDLMTPSALSPPYSPNQSAPSVFPFSPFQPQTLVSTT